MTHVQILERSGLLNLLRLPHFGCGAEVNAVVHVLLSCVHGGYLWLGNRVDLNVDLIHRITGLSKIGKDPEIQTTGKTKDSKLPPALVNKYHLQRGGRAYDITILQNDTLRFTASLLAGRLLTKVWPKEVTGSVINLAIQVTEGEQFNWSLFLLNMLQADCLAAQYEANHPFHFSWILILCAFVGWKEPPNTQFPQLPGGAPRGVRYASLWDSHSSTRK